jgi:selenocysteine lyase/cysteine desulfurase
MSYIGNAAVDLSEVTFFTGSSGKGLGSIPGVGVLLYNEYSQVYSRSKYLDLRFYRLKGNVPFTISTVQVKTLGVSAHERLTPENYQRINDLKYYIFSRAGSSKFMSLELPLEKFVAFFSFRIIEKISSKKLGEFLESKQIFLSFRTPYLIEKNCIEISLLDLHTTKQDLDTFFNLIESYGTNHCS